MNNSYPEKPFLAYQKTSIEMSLAIEAIKRLKVPLEGKKSTYIVFRNESGNGKSGINNNYGGIQTDSGRWPAKYDHLIIGNVTKTENGTGKVRLFAAFESIDTFLEMLSDRLMDRGIYVGGSTHKVTNDYVSDAAKLALIYKREWVTGNKFAGITFGESENFASMYRQATKIFTS